MEKQKVLWIVEQYMFDYEADLLKAIIKNGDAYLLYDVDHMLNDDEQLDAIYQKVYGIREYVNNELSRVVVAHGSIKFIKLINKSIFIPGSFANFEKFKCSYYYPMLKDVKLLNENFIMLPFGCLDYENIISMFGTGYIFIRPDDGSKSFTGRGIDINNEDPFVHELKSIKEIDNVYDNEICLISEGKEIIEEYRFLVVEGKVISGSLYKENDVLSLEEIPEVDDLYIEVQHIADKIGETDFDEIAYTLDMAKHKTYNWNMECSIEYSVVELNSFSSADMYDCNLDKVVNTISEASVNEWKEYNE